MEFSEEWRWALDLRNTHLAKGDRTDSPVPSSLAPPSY